MKRKPITKKVRFDVFKRDGFACQYCGATPPAVILHVDHINPVANGGSNAIDNLVTACAPCNLGKSANLLSEVPVSLKDRAEEIKERELQMAGYNKVLADRRKRIDSDAWKVAAALSGADSVDSFSRAHMQSIRRFLDDLAVEEMCDAARRAYARFGASARTFQYFCGTCWNLIRGRR